MRSPTWRGRRGSVSSSTSAPVCLPTANNTHQVAQGVAPQSRIVYVDNDPLVLAHARALLVSDPAGATDYIDADLRDPDKILRAAAQTLDFTQPIAITMLGIVIFITDDDEAYRIVDRLIDAMPSGSDGPVGSTPTSWAGPGQALANASSSSPTRRSRSSRRQIWRSSNTAGSSCHML